MTGADVKAIREALGRMLGRRVSVRDLGVALGLAPANAGDTVRKWEDEGPTGPAAVALTFMREGTDIGVEDDDPDFQDGVERIVSRMFSSPASSTEPERSRSA